MRFCCIVLIALLSLSCAGPACGDAPITTASLIDEMTDLERLTRLPDPWYRTVQFSSYDRRAQEPGGEGWFSNSDGFGGEPIPNFEAVVREPDESGVGEYLICDVEGPGAIVRTWTAAIAGEIRVFFDGEAEPAYAGSADAFLRRPYESFARESGLDPALFHDAFYQNQAAYCPMPFASRCRIVWIGNLRDIHFYEVQVRLYEPGAQVVTFAGADLAELRAALPGIAAALTAPRPRPTLASRIFGGERFEVPPGASVRTDIAPDSPAAIVDLRVQVQAEDLDQALRQTVMRLYFDGATQAQVESPIGDFFGAAPGVNPYVSVPFFVDQDGTMRCHFVMPFARSARLEFSNLGAEPVSVGYSWEVDGNYEWDPQRSLHFRARWRVDHDLVGDPRDVKDLAFLLARGQGRYVGTTSMLLNPTDVPTPGGGWWGEGDEKIFVDDDEAPSTFGTGSEDYYNYAWSRPDLFAFPYCAQPRNDGPGNRGFVVNNRWHILDDLPFRERLAFYMELFPHMRVEGFSYARIGYYYARPDVWDDHAGITPADVRPVRLDDDWRPRAEGGARNSIFIAAEDVVELSEQNVSSLPDRLYEGGRCLVWRPRHQGETLRFDLSGIEELRGRCSLGLVPVFAPNSGTVRIRVLLRGEPPATCDAVVYEQTLDLRVSGPPLLRRVSSPPLPILEPGSYEVEVMFVGDAGAAVGLDFIWLQKHE